MARTLAVIASLCCAIAFAQPIQVKLNDPGFSVIDLAATRRLFSELGFVLSTGNLTRSAAGFREGGAFEFSEHRDRSEGPRRADLEIASADEAARELRAAGFKMIGPTAGSRVMPGEETLKWFTLEFEDKLDSRPIYMVQVQNREVLHPSFDHPNSVSSLSAILVAVNDLEKAAAGYTSIGKVSSREVAFPEFGAVAREIVLARGSIFLLRATAPSGPTAQHIKSSGEGLLGMRLDVKSLGQARKAVGDKDISEDKRAVLVLPENAAGAWLEFREK